MYDILDLNSKKVAELREIAEKLNISKAEKLKKQDLVYKILDEQALNPSKAENNAKTPKPKVEKEVKKERNKFTPKEKEAKSSVEQNSSKERVESNPANKSEEEVP